MEFQVRSEINELESRLDQVMQSDRFWLSRKIRSLKKLDRANEDIREKLAEISRVLSESVDRRERRLAGLPSTRLDPQLPIFHRREEIQAALAEHQVVVVSGATGSGKSTQLPLIGLQAGYGISGMIGHTQPRRIAARSVATRIASQLNSPLGQSVGYKIRFADKTDSRTYVKLMTDGILLAETQSDRFLDQYSLLIVDEAHERSLNIDFLLGYLKRILPKRRDLRVLITSATIDTGKFADHFSLNPAAPIPIINVEGRTFPVEIRYSPPEPMPGEKEIELDQNVVRACQELSAEGPGDILIFLPTERDIRSVHKKLRAASLGGGKNEVLPLYARLSSEQQNRIFQPHRNRHIVLATNVAESSITVPGIRFVIDTGTARISRYAPRSKVQRLPIEPVSRASADQRAGRCGRVGPGICVRLYSQQDYEERNQYTTPEIRRTNLAAVILRTLSLDLGDIASFPFIDPPGQDSIRDGYKTLFEVGAIDHHRRLTPLGKKIARLPVDPRIARMIYAATDERCLAEILIIASGLEVQDPRVRPTEKQAQADAQHEKFKHPKSDFLSLLKIWDFFHKLREDLSRSKLRTACSRNYLSYNLMQQWLEIHRQLKAMTRDLGLQAGPRRDDYNAIHRSLLAGLLSGLGELGDRHEYTGAGGIKFHLWPGSGVFESKPKWVIAGEVVETSRRFGRVVAKIAPEWIEPLADHLVKRSYSDPHWSRRQQSVMAWERVTLFGLPIVPRRRIGYARIDPETARQILISEGLCGDEFQANLDFHRGNRALLAEIADEAARTRNRDLIIDNWTVENFYLERLPDNICDVAALRTAIRQDKSLNERLTMSRRDLLPDSGLDSEANAFPSDVRIGAMQVPVKYTFSPGARDDGATIEIPVEGIGQIDDVQAGWLIPGLLKERIVALIRSLPKSLRRRLVPAPQTAEQVLQSIRFGQGPMQEQVASELSKIAEQPIEVSDFSLEKVDPHLQPNLRVVGPDGKIVAEGRSMVEVRSQLGAEHVTSVVPVEDADWNRDGITDWDWNELPAEIVITRGATKLAAFPAIVDQLDSVGIRVLDSAAAADHATREGLVRLLQIRHRRLIKSQVNWLPGLDRSLLLLSGILPAKMLKRQLADLIVRIALVENQPVPRTREEFEDRNSDSTESVSVATQQVAKWLPKLAEAVHQALLELEQVPGVFENAGQDIRRQIECLVAEDFISQTGWRWLQHFPRYFAAVSYRIGKLQTTPPAREAELRAEVASFWDRYEDVQARHVAAAWHDPELIQFRWMIEEYRVSLFAQPLGTSISISAKRLEKQWKKVRQL